MSSTTWALEAARRELAELQAHAASSTVFVPPSPPRTRHLPSSTAYQLSVKDVQDAQRASYTLAAEASYSQPARKSVPHAAQPAVVPVPTQRPYRLTPAEKLMSLTRYYSYATPAHEPALLDYYGTVSQFDMQWATPRRSALEAKAELLAEARAELSELQEQAAVADKARQQEESLNKLRAELEYYEGLSRKPQVYIIAPGDPELAIQMPSYYSWLGLAHEPCVADYYSRSGAGGTVSPRGLFAEAHSPGIAQKAHELSQLRRELASLQV